MDSPSPPPDDASAAEMAAAVPALPVSFSPSPLPSSCLEIRLFYVRVSPPSASASPPPALILSHLRRPTGSALEINGQRISPTLPHALPLRRHPPGLTYVSTDPARLAGPAEFEVLLDGTVLLCGSLERADPPWGHPWALHCHATAAAATCLGAQAREVEVYVAGCCAGSPLVLTNTVQLGARRKPAGLLDAIPEDEENGDGERSRDGLYCRRSNQQSVAEEEETDEYEAKLHMASSLYPDGTYYDEDGQLSWFNAGVRVGVGIGMGMCIGVGIGVGILMRSYQATRSTFRRRFF